jgi:hypothetical protein
VAKPTGYAATTKVPVAQTQEDIETLLTRYGASQFLRGWDGDTRAMVSFRMADRNVRILLPLPQGDPQAVKARWRALLLVIKAKLEAVDSGILTLEEAWLPHIVLPNGRTMSEEYAPQLTRVYATGEMPGLLPGLTERKALPGG